MSSTCLLHTTYEWGMIISPILLVIAGGWFFIHACNCWKRMNKLGLTTFSIMGLTCWYGAYVVASDGLASYLS